MLPPILDYIVEDPLSNRYFLKNKATGEQVADYERDNRIGKLTLKVKNMFVYHWLELQKKKRKPSIEESIAKLLKRQGETNSAEAREAKKAARREQ